MKNTSRAKAIFLVLALAYAGSLSAQNQTTDVPRIVSYQGHITNADGAVTGVHPITVRLYSDPDGTHKLWEDTYSADIKDGIFSILLGTRTPLPDSRSLDRPIWLGVSIEGTDELRPLTQFTAAPYALSVPDKSITKEKLSEDLQTLMTKPIGGQEKQSTTAWTFAGDNITTSGDELLGTMSTSNIKNWQLITNGIHTMRFEDNGSATPNIIGGYSGNTISAGIDGGVIAGGGASGSVNTLTAAYTFIGGGSKNTASSTESSVVGGHNNIASGQASFVGGGQDNTATGEESVVGGGQNNKATSTDATIGGGVDNLSSNFASVVAGGDSNRATGTFSSILGGNANLSSGSSSVVGGGTLNSANGDRSGVFGGYKQRAEAHYSFIGGGDTNFISSGSSMSVIGGGKKNTVKSPLSVITGGDTNSVLAASDYGFIGGGRSNYIDTVSPYAVIGGGQTNTVLAPHAVVTGGKTNTDSADYGFMGAGLDNMMYASATASVITGGDSNRVHSPYSVISGGLLNYIGQQNDTAKYSFIGGGSENAIWSAPSSVIAGGHCNWIWSSFRAGKEYNSIGGGYSNRIWGSKAGAISGGYWNKIDTSSDYGFIGGGYWNKIDTSADYSAIAGGYWNKIKSGYSNNLGGYYNLVDVNSNFSSVVGGYRNKIHINSLGSFIGGGDSNEVLNEVSTIGGGHKNSVSAPLSIVGGGSTNIIRDTLIFGTIAGGCENTVTDSIGSVLGGSFNTVDASYGTIGGGTGNHIDRKFIDRSVWNEASYGVIGGGSTNAIAKIPLSFISPTPIEHLMAVHASIVGGSANNASGHYSSIGGGKLNFAVGKYATIPGGYMLEALDYQTVVGRLNRKNDYTDHIENYQNPEFGPYIDGGNETLPVHGTTVGRDYSIFVIGNGSLDTLMNPSISIIENRSNAFEVSDDGHSTVYHVNPQAVAGNGTAFSGTIGKVFLGSTYVNNVIYAWGDVSPDVLSDGTNRGTNGVVVNSSFGVKSVMREAAGRYKITLKVFDPSLINTPVNLTAGAISANIVQTYDDSTAGCHFIFPSEIITEAGTGDNIFRIRIKYFNACEAQDRRFYFIVTGKP